MLEGVVTRSTGSWYQVSTDCNQQVECRIRGKFRLKGLNTTNPVAVGDKVKITQTANGDFVITEIHDRQNYIVRQSPKRKNARHIVAANIDQVLLMATYALPRTSTGFIDRFLMTAEAYEIPAVLVFNKMDLLDDEQKVQLAEIVELYRSIGYVVVCSSLIDNGGVEEIRQLISSKLSLIAGHSGVGKSTLLNELNPQLNLRTGIISEYHSKGKHTTTFAEMIRLEDGTSIIDTPGIKEFGVLDFKPFEVGQYFREFVPIISECGFSDCLHLKEPKCAVFEATKAGEIHTERYKNYLNILADVQAANNSW